MRQIVPRSAGAQNPKNAIQHRSRILPRSASPIVPPFRTKQGSSNAHWASVRSMLLIYASLHKFQASNVLKVFMR